MQCHEETGNYAEDVEHSTSWNFANPRIGQWDHISYLAIGIAAASKVFCGFSGRLAQYWSEQYWMNAQARVSYSDSSLCHELGVENEKRDLKPLHRSSDELSVYLRG